MSLPPSFEKFNYALRPAKNMQRKMLCESLARLAAIAPVPSYEYIGFGAVGFVDFALFHRALGMCHMTSIERYVSARARIEYNRPFSCIDIKWGDAKTVLPTLSWDKRAIVWLDYEQPLDAEVLGDLRVVLSSVRSGSIVLVTVDADRRERKLSDVFAALADAVGGLRHLPVLTKADGAPRRMKPGDLRHWGLAAAFRNVIDSNVRSVLAGRSAASNKMAKLQYKQLFNFRYRDGAMMTTVGGIVAHQKDLGRLCPSHFSDLSFVTGDDRAYEIEVPVLTMHELRYLNARLPSRRVRGLLREATWLPRVECERYRRVYRYFPAFSEIEGLG